MTFAASRDRNERTSWRGHGPSTPPQAHARRHDPDRGCSRRLDTLHLVLPPELGDPEWLRADLRRQVAAAEAAEAAAAAARPIEADELVVVLSHHPFHGGWLRDAQEANAWVRSHAHLHLFGHVHEADSEEARWGSGSAIVRVAAGATHGEQNSPAEHGYNIAAVMRMPNGELRLRLWPRRWSSKNKAFRPDADNLPEGQIFTEHVLQQKRAD